jgi:NAD(P)-dependent dehydrogenase (short-subunit alcohol dehydrogenase family)
MSEAAGAGADLAGRKALVMGANSPAAAAIALALAQAGADVAITTTTSDAEEAFNLRRLRKRITDLGRRSMDESADLSLPTNVQITVRQVAKELGGIDLMAIEADFRLIKPADKITDSDWARVIGLNLSAVFYACRSVYREMQRQDAGADGIRGRIIVVTTQPEALSNDADAIYVAAKSGVAGLIASLAPEWQPAGVLVNAIAVSAKDDAGMAAAAVALATTDTAGQVLSV